ncbi:MAG: flagellar filament capping protein FliD [Thermoleophilia bacterium]|nr:flagellar filament capping protein FliD [Thermoleophilia bacterium]
MSTFSVGGLASGLDTKTIISQLMSIESQPKTMLQWKQQLWTARKNAWSDLNTRLNTLQTKANALLNPVTWDASASSGSGSTSYVATSADPSRLSASVTGSGAPVGLHTVDVLQLAQGQISASTGSLSPATSGTFRTAQFFEGNNNIVEGNETLNALRTNTGTSMSINTNSVFTMSWTSNGVTQTAQFKNNTVANGGDGNRLSDLATWVANTIGNGATAQWVNGALEVTTAPGTVNELSDLSFTGIRSNGATLTAFDTRYDGTGAQSVAAFDGGVNAADTLTITNGSGSWNVAVSVGDDLAAIAGKINGTAGIGVSALVNGSGQLEIRSNGIGASEGFSVTSAGALASQLGFTTTQNAQDASFRVDGAMQSSATNVGITGVLTDVTLNLLGPTSTTLDIQPDTGTPGVTAQDAWVDATKKKVQDFVSAYNEVLSFVHAKTQEEDRVASPKNLTDYLAGPMARDVGFSSVAFDLRRIAGDTVSGLPADANLLSQIGIDSQFAIGSSSTNGQLTIDDAELDAALRADPQKVQDVLGHVGAGSGITSDDGIVRRISEQVSILRVGGRVDTALTGATSRIKDIQDSIDRMTDRLDRRQQYYERMFSSLETTLGKLQSQGNWLSGQIASMMGQTG